MSRQNLDALAARLKARAAEGQFAEAQRALEAYSRAVVILRGSLARGDPGIRKLERQAMELLEETRRQVVQGRAHAAVRRARLRTPATFAADIPRHTWEILG